jgi:hypothetical protein
MSNDALQQALEIMASNWSKKPQWVEDMGMVWASHPRIVQASPGQLNRAALHCMSELDYAPKLKDFLAALDSIGANTQAAPAHPDAPACEGCQGNRVVEVALWRSDRACVTSVSCPSCNKGRSLHEWQASWEQADPSLTQVIWGWRRTLTSAERGSTPRGQVIPLRGRVQFTPNPEQFDLYRRDRVDAEKRLREEGWR